MTADSFGTRSRLAVGDDSYDIFRLDRIGGSARLPYSLKVLLENLLRNEDGTLVTAEQGAEIQFTPARVLPQDFTGVPCVVDLIAMRDAMAILGGDPGKINPLIPADLVIDHSVIADVFDRPDAFAANAELEFTRNRERYQLLRWAQQAFDGLRVVPPDTGICHQVNLEYLARVVFTRGGQAYPDTLVGTDSHTSRSATTQTGNRCTCVTSGRAHGRSPRSPNDPRHVRQLRLRNRLLPGIEGGFTRHPPGGEQMSIYDAATAYAGEQVPLIVLAGSDYGAGSSRDWAAKGTLLFGVKAVIAESYERIHRSNLIGMGVLPLQFTPGGSAESLGLTGKEVYSITGLAGGPLPREVAVGAEADDHTRVFTVTVRIDTPAEATYFRHGGILQYVLRQLAAS